MEVLQCACLHAHLHLVLRVLSPAPRQTRCLACLPLRSRRTWLHPRSRRCRRARLPSETFRVPKDREMREFGEYRACKRVLDALGSHRVWRFCPRLHESAKANIPRNQGGYQRYPYAVRTVISPLVMEDDRDKIVSSDRVATSPRGSCARQGGFFHINIWVR